MEKLGYKTVGGQILQHLLVTLDEQEALEVLSRESD